MSKFYSPFKNIWQFILVHIIIGVISLFAFVENPTESVSKALIGIIWGMAIFATQWAGHAYIQRLIGLKYNWKDQALKRLILTVLSIVAYAVLGFLIVQSLMEFIVFGTIPKRLWSFDLNVWGLPILLSFFFSLVTSVIGFFLNWRNALVEQEKLKAEMLTYKYESLRNQINPHFMFNSLNVLSELVYDDQKLAVKFIHQFSDIYRYVLDSRDKEVVELKDEILFIDKFIFLLKIRFDEKLQFKMDIEFEEDDYIIPLALQMLIENAVKHNEVSKLNPLHVSVIRKEDRIVISNPIRVKNIGDNSKKIGLQNLESQFSYLSDKKLIIDKTDELFSASIPIIKKV